MIRGFDVIVVIRSARGKNILRLSCFCNSIARVAVDGKLKLETQIDFRMLFFHYI